MKRLFIDTNVLVDLVCRREPFFQESKRLFALAYSNWHLCLIIYQHRLYSKEIWL